MLSHLHFFFQSYDDSVLLREFNKFLFYFCKSYTLYPDYIFGLFDAKEPLISFSFTTLFIYRSETVGDTLYWKAHFPVLTEDHIHDCAKLDECYFTENPIELYTCDFCTVLTIGWIHSRT